MPTPSSRPPLPRVPASEPLVGRAAELAAVAQALSDDERLVTLAGAPGVGKSALALELARRVGQGQLPPLGEALVAPLASASSLASLLDALAASLGLSGATADVDAGLERAARALSARGEVLLVLDDLDASLPGAAGAVARLLSRSPLAQLLVTSRGRLGLPSERVLEIGPLPVPHGSTSPRPSDAARLFARRGEQAGARVSLEGAEAEVCEAIVAELEGLPLSIELAASRLAVMAPRALLHRLRTRLDVLRRAGAQGRHASLEAAIEASFAGLAPHEQSALAQLSVLGRSFDAETAEATVDLSPFAPAPSSLDVVQSLRERSLLQAVRDERSGEVRLSLLRPVREHAASKASAELLSQAEARAERHLVSQAEAWASRGDAEAEARLLGERDALLGLVERALSRGPLSARAAEPALRALLALGPVLFTRGPLASYIALLDPALRASRASGVDAALVARALLLRGVLCGATGKRREGARDLVQALGVARARGDRALEARALHQLGRALAWRGEIEQARAHLGEAAQLAASIGNHSDASASLVSLGWLEQRAGSPAEARGLGERAAASHRRAGQRLALASALRLVAASALDEADHDAAGERAAEALSIAASAGDGRGEALAQLLSGAVLLDRGAAASARQAFQRASERARASSPGPVEGAASLALSLASLWLGERAEAHVLLDEALALLGPEPEPSTLVVALTLRAGLESPRGPDAARASLERALALPEAALSPSAAAGLSLARASLSGASSGGARRALGDLSPSSFVARVLGRFLVATASSPPPPPPPFALVVGPKGAWFRPPGGERASLEQRRSLSLLLAHLTEQRTRAPGQAVSWDSLLEAGWPGEKVLAQAGQQRVRVAIATLRKLGLREVLLTSGDGYLLSPDIPVVAA